MKYIVCYSGGESSAIKQANLYLYIICYKSINYVKNKIIIDFIVYNYAKYKDNILNLIYLTGGF